MIPLQDFITQWNNKKCCCAGDCVSPDSICQCVALSNQWCCDNKWPVPRGGTAATLSFPAGWEFIEIAAAKPGDLVIWNSDLGGSNGDGHVAIFKANLSTGFQVFGQNWEQDLCEITTMSSYTSVRGAYHYTLDQPPPVVNPPSVGDDMPKQTAIPMYPILLGPPVTNTDGSVTELKAYTADVVNANVDDAFLTVVGCDQGDSVVDLIWTDSLTGEVDLSLTHTGVAVTQTQAVEAKASQGVLRGVIVNHGPGSVIVGCKLQTK